MLRANPNLPWVQALIAQRKEEDKEAAKLYVQEELEGVPTNQHSAKKKEFMDQQKKQWRYHALTRAFVPPPRYMHTRSLLHVQRAGGAPSSARTHNYSQHISESDRIRDGGRYMEDWQRSGSQGWVSVKDLEVTQPFTEPVFSHIFRGFSLFETASATGMTGWRTPKVTAPHLC